MFIEEKMKVFTIFFGMIVMVVTLYGCKSEPVPQLPKATKTTEVTQSEARVSLLQSEAEIQETVQTGGYIYDRKNRRDPFVPLIIPTKKFKKDNRKIGTIESYDITEFTLAAIAKKGTKYYALVVAPDNKSFTIHKGDIIGINGGKVESITRNKVVIVEYTRNYKGELKPRQIILEFRKGEGE
jgi:Tfp pilus assembly protein PilP